MRRTLDAVYALSAGLAAVSLFGIFAVMMAQIVLRQFAMQFSGSDDLSAYLCVGTTFLGLAATFKRGELVRVGMFLEKMSPNRRRFAELFAPISAWPSTTTIPPTRTRTASSPRRYTNACTTPGIFPSAPFNRLLIR